MNKRVRLGWRSCLFLLLLAIVARAEAPASAPATAESTREAFLKLIDRPRVDPAPEVKEESSEAGISRFHFSYASEANQRVPGILLRPAAAGSVTRRPAVIVLHGTGGKKEGELPVLKALAAKGFVAVAIDGRFHGERGTPSEYNAAIAAAFEHGGSHPLYYDTVWDVMRLVDYLQSRPDVDGKRIGLMGISKGGIETWLASAADPRIAVAVPCIGMQSFRWGLDHDAWPARVGTVKKGFDAAAKSAGVDHPDAAFARNFYDRVIPGICDRFDGPVMITLVAPRPLLLINGEKDPLNPIPGLRLCEQAAIAAYARDGAPDRFKLMIEPNTAHAVTPESNAAAVEWFVKWLQPQHDASSP